MSASELFYPMGLTHWQLAVVMSQSLGRLLWELFHGLLGGRTLYLQPDGEAYSLVVDGNGGVLVIASPEAL